MNITPQDAALILETANILAKLTQQAAAVMSASTPAAQAEQLATAQADVQTAAAAFVGKE